MKLIVKTALFCALSTVAVAAHDGQAPLPGRPTDGTLRELDPSAGIFLSSENPLSRFKPKEIDSLHDMTAQPSPLFCRRNPPINLHQEGVKAFHALAKDRDISLERLKEEYETQYGGAAKKALEAFKKAGGIPFEIARRYRFTKAGDEAAKDSLSMLFQASSFPLFAAYFDEYLADHADMLDACDDDAKIWATQAFVSNLRINDKDRAKFFGDALTKCQVDPLLLLDETKTVKEWLEQRRETPAPFSPNLQAQFVREVMTYTKDPALCTRIEGCDPEDYCSFHAKFSMQDTARLAEQVAEDEREKILANYAVHVRTKLVGSKPARAKELEQFVSHMLFHKDPAVATVAARAIREFPSPSSAALLGRAVNTPSEPLFWMARTSLEEAGLMALPFVKQAIEREKDDLRKKHLTATTFRLTAQGDALRDLRSEEPITRRRAINNLQGLMNDTVLKQLIDLLDDASETTREATVAAIQTNVPPPESFWPPGLAERLRKARFPQGQIASLYLLKNSLPYLLDRLKNPDPGVQRAALAQLRYLQDDKSVATRVEALRSFLTDKSVSLSNKQVAVETLSVWGERSKSALPEIRSLLKQEKEKDRRQTLTAYLVAISDADEDLKSYFEAFKDQLGTISLKLKIHDLGKRAAPILRELLAKDPNNEDLKMALESAE